MTAKRGKKVQEALRDERFTKSVVRVKLSPAEMVRILRQKNELTQSALAERTGLTQSTISNLENGRTQLGAERAKTLARALRVHPAVLLFPGWDVAKESAAQLAPQTDIVSDQIVTRAQGKRGDSRVLQGT